MQMTAYPTEFFNLLDYLEDKNWAKSDKYIGTGNPVGNILIIGKECAIDKDGTPEQKEQYIREIEENFSHWFSNAENNMTQSSVKKEDWFEKGIYNPIYPYKGQKYTIERRYNISCKGGTSTTWHNYQKLYDSICDNGVKDNKNRIISFHEGCFISELSIVTAPSSIQADHEKRKASIEKRNKIFGENDFFRRFPITILATGKKYAGDKFIKSLGFPVEKTGPYCELSTGNWYRVYTSNDRNRILIHTRQMSCGISKRLICEIARNCKTIKI